MNNTASGAARLAAVVSAAAVIALSAVVSGIGVAALIFTGPLQPFLFVGIGIVLFGAAVMLIVVALKSSYPGTISLPQEVPAVILGLLATAMFVDLTTVMSAEDALPFVLLAIAFATIITGTTYWVLGRLRMGELIRFIPYPMIGGVLAGLGWLLVQGGVMVLTGEVLSVSDWAMPLQGDNPLRLAAGLAVGASLLVLTTRHTHFLLIPGVLVISIAAFYAIAVIAGLTATELSGAGWLLGPFPDRGAWAPPLFAASAEFDWELFFRQLPVLATLVLASTISILLYASGLELGVRRDLDLNHELRSCGAANVIAGVGGGVPGFHSMGDSLLAHAMGAPYRATGVLAGVFVAAGLFGGFSALAYFPRPVLGGLLLYLGLSLLREWIVDGYRKLPKGDWLVVLLILGVSGWFGFLAGIGVGVVAGMILFTVNYSGVDVAKHELSAASLHSRVDRPPGERAYLDRNGDSVHVLMLQGFVFFGTANKVLDRIAMRVADVSQPALTHLCLDFQRVTGTDTSAVITFRKLDQLAETQGFEIVLTGLPDDARVLFEDSGLELDENPRVTLERDLDHGLEYCERALLRDREGADLASAVLPPSLGPEVLERYAEICVFSPGDYLIEQGAPSDDMFMILKGRVTVKLDGMASGERLRTYGPGTLVGEMAMYLGGRRSASVVAETSARAMKLTLAGIRRMTTEEPQLAAELHRTIAAALAGRLAKNNELLRLLA
ncbi:MAG: SulP family inorganic anion transporter [Gammaproteobacteria bacterium]